MENIGGSGVAVALPFILIIYKIFGIVGATIGILIGYIVISIITMKITKFEIISKKRY